MVSFRLASSLDGTGSATKLEVKALGDHLHLINCYDVGSWERATIFEYSKILNITSQELSNSDIGTDILVNGVRMV